MNYQRSFIGYFLILFLAFSSCEKDLKTEIQVNPKLCFNCILNPDSIIQGSLSFSQSISKNEPITKINDAIIELNMDGQIIDTLENVGNGKYRLNIKPCSGGLYKIRIINKEFPVLYASTTVPGKPSVTYQKGEPELHVINEYYSYSTYQTTYTIHDKPGINRYWNYTISKFNDKWHFYGGYGGNDSPFFDDFNKDIDATYENGFFYQYYLRINDFGFEGSSFSFKDTYSPEHVIESFFLDADEHYDKYLKSSIKQMMNDDGSLLFNEPVQIYSNIENGLGIFGSAAITKIKL
jgi:hypothetical protein